MEIDLEEQNAIPFVGIDTTKRGNRVETSVGIESLRTLVYFFIIKARWETVQTLFTLYYDPNIVLTACHLLLLRFHRNATSFRRSIFLNRDYPTNLIDSSINKFLHNIDSNNAQDNAGDDNSAIILLLPFKDQQSANSVKRQMQSQSANIGVQIKPVFQSKKIGQVLVPKEQKPLLSTISAWLKSQCNLCDGLQPGIYTNALANSNIQQSGSILFAPQNFLNDITCKCLIVFLTVLPLYPRNVVVF